MEGQKPTRTVLLVEDTEQLRVLYRLILEDAGFRVVEASDGAQALARGDDQIDEIDVLVTDLSLPGMGGRELAERLRERRPDLPVLFASGSIEPTDAPQESLGQAFLGKPFRRREFVELVDQLSRGGVRV